MAEFTSLASLAGDDVLLATKLFIPSPRPNAVLRPALVERLNRGLESGRRLTVISAPPGFGKTSLLAEWLAGLRQTSAYSVAWLALDARDNEPRRFFVYCIAALQTIRPEIGQNVLAVLNHQPPGTANPQTLLTMLINEMATLRRRVVFVVDDYHLIESETIHNGLAFLLQNQPPLVHLVIASRRSLPISLTRQRGQGQVTELRQADLRFTAEETSAFLARTMGLSLSAADITVLEERTEGWIAGLQIAALSMQGRAGPETHRFVQEFSGSHQHVLDYLLVEVLQRQPGPIQAFLLQTAILERLCGPLCDALVTGLGTKSPNGESGGNGSLADNLPHLPGAGRLLFAGSQSVLEYLEQANLFVVSLDDRREWYRYHHLFADLLRTRLKQTITQAQIAELHRRASDWFEQASLPAEAMHHALAAVDVAHISRLARQKASALLSQGELVTLLSWLDALPRSLVRSRSGISLLQAWAMVLTGQLESVEPHLQQAERESDEPASIAGEVATLRATVAYFNRDMARAVQLYQQALRVLPADSFLRGCVVQSLGAAHSWQGQVLAARQAFTEASAISRETGNLPVHLVAEWTLALLHLEQAQLRQATATFRQEIALVEQQPERDQLDLLPFAGRLQVGLAGVLLEQNELELAGSVLQRGLEIGHQTGEGGTLSGGYLVQARLRLAQNDVDGAVAAIQQASQHTGPYYLSAQVAAFQGRLQLAQGYAPLVANWLRSRLVPLQPLPEAIPYLQEDEYLLLARLALVDTAADLLDFDEPALAVADELLTRLKEAAQRAARFGRVLEVLLVQALVLQAQQRVEAALAVLGEALALAEPEGYVRIFLDEGPALIDLLRRAAAKNMARQYVARLLEADGQALPGVESDLLLDPLSERELEILQLIAEGHSNKKLADMLVLTVGTVKWHLNNIYSKLGVRSRTQAIARAREVGLID